MERHIIMDIALVFLMTCLLVEVGLNIQLRVKLCKWYALKIFVIKKSMGTPMTASVRFPAGVVSYGHADT